MTDLVPEVVSGSNRRSFIRNGLIVSAGVIGLSAAAAAFSGAAWASSVTVGADQYSVQNGWWYCIKCKALFHAGSNTSAGVCPVGGQHADNQSYNNYYVPYNGAAQSTSLWGVQPGWAWCNKCAELFWANAPSSCVCPKGGQHAVGSNTQYDLLWYAVSSPQQFPPNQYGWLYCIDCASLYWGNVANNHDVQYPNGVCPATGPSQGPHDTYATPTIYCMVTGL